MLEHGVIIGLLTLSIWYTMQEGEIFSFAGRWFEKHTPTILHPPLFECNVCLTFWYGSVLYWIIFHESVLCWIVSVIVAMGINIIINKWTHEP